MKDGLGRAAVRAALATMLCPVLAGCSPADGPATGTLSPQAAPEARATATAGTAQAAGSATGSGGTNFQDNATKGKAVREFAYKWPAQAAAVPQLLERFTAERDAALAQQKADWDAAIREFAGQDCGGCMNQSFEKTWEVVADTPRFLSLSASIYTYTGGAHGNGGYDALVWDREAKAALDPEALFRSPAALQDALGAEWCKALKVERQKRLGENYSDDGFFQCPPVSDLTVLLGSKGGQTFDRIGLLAAPYVAGSYSEGTYEVTLPVTAQVLAAVRPEYKAAFAPGT